MSGALGRDRLRLVFMGSPAFAVPSLRAILDAGHEVVCVYTQPPRPSGRGQATSACPVHAFAETHRLAVRTPKSLRPADERERFAALDCDAAVVAAYGLILPAAILSAPRLGCFNVHASLLPRWRGAAPIQRAILAGDDETGISIMRVEAGLDTGPILLRRAVPITAAATGGTLHDTLSELGAQLLVEALDGVVAGSIVERPQPDDGATYAAKIGRDDERLDWTHSAARLERAVRALAPAPGVWFEHGGERIKVLEARVTDRTAAPGTVLADPFAIACGEGALVPLRLQRPGRKPLDAAAFLRGHPLAAGTRLG